MKTRSIQGEYRKRRQVQDQAERRASEVIKVDKNIPIPGKKSGPIRKHPDFSIILKEMDIGDSLAFDVDYERKGQPISSAATVMRTTACALGLKVTQRMSEDRKTIRVWRVA